MFFYIGKDCPLQSLTQVQTNLYLDKGWSNIDGAYVKGYSTECSLYQSVNEIINGYRPRGKWCIIYDNVVYHPNHRGYPVMKRENSITNIPFTDGIMIAHELSIPKFTSNLISIDDASIKVGDILLENFQGFIKYNDPVNLKLKFTGGLDTATAWAILNNITTNYSLVVYMSDPCNPRFSEYQSDLIDHMRNQLWTYNLLRYYNEPNWFVTGFDAERIQLREVTNGQAILSFLKKNLFDYLQPSDYLYYFLKKQPPGEEYNFHSEEELRARCYQEINYDYQGWHLDNNYHFCPFFDYRITDVVYQMSLEDIILNIRNGVIQRNIIKRFNPTMLELIAEYKNTFKVYDPFKNNFHKLKLDPNVKVEVYD